MKLFATARFLCSLISGRRGAALAGRPPRMSHRSRRDLAGRAVILKVDTERFPELASRYNVQGIPNFAVFARGSLLFQQAGLVDAKTMKGWLTRAA